MPAPRRQEVAARSRRMGRREVVQLNEALELRASSQGAIPSAGGGADHPQVMPCFESNSPPGSDVPVVGEVGPPCSALAAPVVAAPVPSAAPAPAQRRWLKGLSDVPPSYRRTNPGNEPWRNYVLPDGSISMRPRGGSGFP
jgi:hypothetical protein